MQKETLGWPIYFLTIYLSLPVDQKHGDKEREAILNSIFKDRGEEEGKKTGPEKWRNLFRVMQELSSVPVHCTEIM